MTTDTNETYPQETFLKMFEYLSNNAADAFFSGDRELHRYYLDGWVFLSRFINTEWGK